MSLWVLIIILHLPSFYIRKYLVHLVLFQSLLELEKQYNQKKNIEGGKADIGWGSQIRSYVLDQSRIKDLRTNYELTNTQSVLDGNINPFIEAYLKMESKNG